MVTDTLDIGIVHMSKNALPEFEEIIQNSELPQGKFTVATLAPDTLQCDRSELVFLILGEEDSLPKFAEKVSRVKLVCHVPTVIAVVPAARRYKIDELLGSLPADMVINYPIDMKEINEALHTLMAVHDIHLLRSRRFRNRKPLGTILVENNVISSYQLSRALEYSEKESVKLGKALLELGFVPEERMNWFLSAQIGVELATVQHYSSISKEVSDLITESFAEHNLCIPCKSDDGELFVIMSDPKDLQLLDRLRDITEMRIVPLLGRNADILMAISRVYKSISNDAETSELFRQSESDFALPEQGSTEFSDGDDDEGIIKLVKLILLNASKERASDIHIEPRDTELVIRYRIDGELRRMMSSPLNSARPLITRLKIMSDLDIAERRLPQDGRFVIPLEKGVQIDARLSILPTVFGEKAVIRILDSSNYGNDLSKLGLAEQELETIRREIKKPYGLIIITGPTGSGKTTTLYSALQELTGDTRNVVSVEDPVEYRMPEVSQVQVNTSTGLTFATALRSILRQDPDVVMIGEIRDAETADIAVKMALTGHLVFATLHTNDAPSAITRLVNIGIPPLLLSSCLNLIVAQRLVKRICEQCREEIDVPAHLASYLPEESGITKVSVGKGCVTCHSNGYSGRIGLYEMLEVSPTIREMIVQNQPENVIRDEAVRSGMNTLFKAGISHVENGATTLEQVIAFLK